MAKFRDDEIVIAWQSFAVDGVDEVIRKGTKLRGSHPAVKKVPQFFVRDGTLESEWPSEFDAAVEQAERTDAAEKAERARRSPPPIPPERAVEVAQSFTIGGMYYAQGRIVHVDSEIVKTHPELFVRVKREPLV